MREETGYETDDDPDSFMELDQEELDRARKLWEIEQQLEEGEIFTQEEYDRIKYEEPLIKQLRSVEVRCYEFLGFLLKFQKRKSVVVVFCKKLDILRVDYNKSSFVPLQYRCRWFRNGWTLSPLTQ